MKDDYNRSINYLRLSITDRCNFRCRYCLPSKGVEWLTHSDILSYEEILRLIVIFNREGITRIRLTGGEPLVRKGLVDFVAAISSLGMIDDLSLTTNGSLLAPMAGALKAAGLNRVNISLDTANPARFTKITSCGLLDDTLRGIESALACGLTPVKLNVVLTEEFGKTDLAYFVDQVYHFPVNVRFIEYMPVGGQGGNGPTVAEIKDSLNAAGLGKLEPMPVDIGNGPAKNYRLPGTQGTFGFITPLTDHFCGNCNRLRLTADGKLVPCLLSDRAVDIKTPLRAGACDDELAELFRLAVRAKPERHSLCRTSGHADFGRSMWQIGG